MKLSNSLNIRLFLAALLITTIAAAFNYIVHNPKVGIDDANITQTYAENIAKGHGYVYNSDGERVEGSTSLLWTLINSIFYIASDTPEPSITALCFFLTALIVREVLSFVISAAKSITASRGTAVVWVGFLFLTSPSFFGWSIWALMDFTLWTFFFSAVVLRMLTLILEANNNETAPWKKNFLLYSLLILMPLVRPEGLAISIGFCAFLFVFFAALKFKNLQREILAVLAGTVLISAGITIFRLQYFGYPLPNTFYAKVSISYLDQTILGLKYLIRYFLNPSFLLTFILSFCGLLVICLKRVEHSTRREWFASLFLCAVLGILSIYVFLGGDHFGSFRQYQVITPLLVGFASLFLLFVVSLIRTHSLSNTTIGTKLLLSFVTIILVTALTLPSVVLYYKDGGNIRHEFRIAEDNRALGLLLNDLPNQPSLGVIVAGGISRTYDGKVYDMMGLNWVEMAHANRGHNKRAAKNHAAFDKEIFLRQSPEIVIPSLGACKEPEPSELRDAILDGLLTDERFKSNYKTACFRGSVFFVRNDYYKKWANSLKIPN